MSAYMTWEEAQALAKRSPQRGYMGPASAIEIALPDIAGTFARIKEFAPVPLPLRLKYEGARSKALAYGGKHRIEAEHLLDDVLDSLKTYRDHTPLTTRIARYGRG